MTQEAKEQAWEERLWTLSDEAWERIAELFPRANGKKGFEQEIPSRHVFEAVLYRMRLGCPWRDLPPAYGYWHAIYMRWQRWVEAGVPERVAAAVQKQKLTSGELDLALVLLDSTVVRAHQHAAGARKKRGPQALGRSRGGFGSKLHLAAVSEKGGVIAAAVSPGQCGDAPVAAALLEKVCELEAVKTVCADRAYDSDAIRAQIKAAGKRAAIPPMKGRKRQYRYGKKTTYRQRNRIERLVNRLKQFRAIATRYEKLKDMFLALVSTALIVFNL